MIFFHKAKTSIKSMFGRFKRIFFQKKIFGIYITVVFALLAIYLAGVVMFSMLCPLGSSVNGISIGFITPGSASSRIEDVMMNQTIDISYSEEYGSSISACDVSQSVDKDEIERSISKISDSFNPWLWFMNLSDGSRSIVDSRIIYPDTEKIEKIIMESEYCSDSSLWEKSADAYIEYDENDSEYRIVDDIQGTEVDTGKAAQVISDILSEHSSDALDIAESGLYKKASVTGDDEGLRNNLNRLNSRLNMSIGYDSDEIVLDGKTITEWMFQEDGTVSMDADMLQDKAKAFVSDRLVSSYSTDSTSHTFKSATGEEKTVEGGNLSKTVNVENESQAIADIIIKGKSVEGRLPEMDGYERDTNGGLGDTFVEIDMTAQKCYYVEDGKVKYKTDCVTGTYTDKGRRTPEGVYYVYFMQKGRTLTGEKNEYSTYVNYWMAFNVGIGLHDATWRSSFGGSIYMYSGSHGCVNLPYSFAEKLYSDLEIGVPVVCYY